MKPSLVIPFVALSLSGCLLSPDAPEDCAAADTCGVCLARSGCGWCPGAGCVPGDSLGPANAAGLRPAAEPLCLDDYRWDECAPRFDPCVVHATEAACVLATDCQWCSPGGGCRIYGDGCTPTWPSGVLCTDTCRYAGDGACDDGGPGASYSLCELGTDCGDCGPRL